jgi:hypothetical protein
LRLDAKAIARDHIHVSADVSKVRVQRYTTILPKLNDPRQSRGPIPVSPSKGRFMNPLKGDWSC